MIFGSTVPSGESEQESEVINRKRFPVKRGLSLQM